MISLPDGWCKVRLGDLLIESNVKAKHLTIDTDKLPILSMTRYNGLILQTKKFDKRVAGKDIANYQVVKKNNIVYSFPIDEGVIYALKRFEIGLVSPTYFVWKIVDKNIDVDYLDLLLKTPDLIRIYTMLSTRTVHRRRIIKKNDFKQIRVKIPPLLEQKKICSILSTINEAKEKTENFIISLKKLRKSLIEHLFSYGVVKFDEIEKVKTQKTEIGEIPEKWKIKKLNNIFRLTGGKKRPKDNLPMSEGKNIFPVYGGNGIMGYAKNKLLDENVMIIGRVGEHCGAVYLSKEACWVSDNALYVKEWLSDINLDYIRLALEKLNLNRLKRTGGQPLITQSLVYSQSIPFPSEEEQQNIVTIISTIDMQIQVEKRNKQALVELFKSMLYNLMNAKIRVNNLEA